MKLLLADDHTLFRDAIVQFIQRAEPDAQIMVGSDVHDVMEIMEQHGANFDLVLLDFRMPGMDGLQGLKKLREAFPAASFVLLSGLVEEEDVRRALEIGARGYFPKTLSARALLSAIHRVIDGDEYVARDHNNDRIMASYNHGKTQDEPFANNNIGALGNVKLTPREQEVLGYLLSGASNKEIARALDLQVVTVKLHIRGVCRKLGAKNRTQAALAARELGITEATAGVPLH